MASSAEKLDYDDMLLNILQREGNVDNFLDVFFGFLNRNTDFFRIMADPTASFGFPPGIARQKVFNTFKAFEETSFAANPADRQAVQASICCARRRTDQRQMPPPSTKPKKSASNEKVTPKKSPVKKSSSDTSCASSTPITDSSSTSSSSTASQSTKDGSEASSPSEPETQAEAPPANNEVEVSEFQNNPDSYNGAVREKFSWSQNITEVDLRVFVEKDIRKGKQVKVDIKEQSVKVAVLKDGKFETVVEGDLKWKVHPTKSMWTMVPGDHIHVSLEKAQERWWEACFEGEDTISLRSIDCSRPMEDLDQESLATVNKLKFDQQQKQQGLPTSEQMKVMESLRAGWDVEGSPFKGQPFDPNLLNFG